jgi:hypothetical protein
VTLGRASGNSRSTSSPDALGRLHAISHQIAPWVAGLLAGASAALVGAQTLVRPDQKARCNQQQLRDHDQPTFATSKGGISPHAKSRPMVKPNDRSRRETPRAANLRHSVATERTDLVDWNGHLETGGASRTARTPLTVHVRRLGTVPIDLSAPAALRAPLAGRRLELGPVVTPEQAPQTLGNRLSLLQGGCDGDTVAVQWQ